ncbi:hypothetical protein [Candidatus Pyrohabitans sp.]
MTSPVYAGFFDDFAKVRYKFSEFVKDPKLLKGFIENEYLNPVLKKDPYSKYQKHQRIQAGEQEPPYMQQVREKFNGYFSRLDGYALTEEDLAAVERLGISEVSLAIMDDRQTYYLKRIYVAGGRVRVDGQASKHMVAVSPQASQELALMLDNILADNFVDSREAKQLGSWGKQRYESGDIAGKRKDIETILNFLLGGG